MSKHQTIMTALVAAATMWIVFNVTPVRKVIVGA